MSKVSVKSLDPSQGIHLILDSGQAHFGAASFRNLFFIHSQGTVTKMRELRSGQYAVASTAAMVG